MSEVSRVSEVSEVFNVPSAQLALHNSARHCEVASHSSHRALRICQYVIASEASQSQSHGVPPSLLNVKNLST